MARSEEPIPLWPISIYQREETPAEWFAGRYIEFPPVEGEWAGETRLKFHTVYFTRGNGQRYYYYVPLPMNLEVSERG